MRLYFDTVVMEDDNRSLIERFSKFRTYVGSFVKSLILLQTGPQGRYVSSILSSCPNLQQLGISWQRGFDPTPRSRFFPSKLPFHLRLLVLSSIGRQKVLVDLIRKQRMTIVHLQTRIDHEDLDLPMPLLRVLGGPMELLMSHLRSSPEIRCYELDYITATTPCYAPSIRALRVWLSSISLIHIPNMFPNLRFMEFLDVSLLFLDY